MSTRVALRDLGLQPGQAKHQELEVELLPYRQGGFDYSPRSGSVPARIDITAMQTGFAFRLRMDPELEGPCSRCLEPAVLNLEIDSHEVHDPLSGDEELICDFVTADDLLDLSAWAQDALGLEFPVRVLCKEDCAGLCATCGADHNIAPCNCTVQASDSRWDKLRDLKFDEL